MESDRLSTQQATSLLESTPLNILVIKIDVFLCTS